MGAGFQTGQHVMANKANVGVWVEGTIGFLEDDGQFRVQYHDDTASIESNIDPWRIQLYDDYVATFKVGQAVFVNWLELGIWWTGVIVGDYYFFQ